MTHDKLSAIGRVAILTSASEESSDPYVEVTTADARMLLDEHHKLAKRVEVVDLLLPVLGATVASTDLANARDAVATILLALDRAAPSGGPHPVLASPASGDARSRQDAEAAPTGDLGTFERLTGAPAKPEPEGDLG